MSSPSIQEDEDIPIGWLVNSYRLDESVINALVAQVGAKRIPDELDSEFFPDGSLATSFNDYRVLIGSINAFFDSSEEGTRQALYEGIIMMAGYCGSAVDYKARREQLVCLGTEQYLQELSERAKKAKQKQRRKRWQEQREKDEKESEGLLENFSIFPSLGAFDDSDEPDQYEPHPKLRSLYAETVALAIRDLSNVNMVSAVLFLKSYNIPMLFENGKLTFTAIEEIIDEYTPLTPEVKAEWERAIEEYEEKFMERKNDKLPRYLRILLERLDGASRTDLELEHYIQAYQVLSSAVNDCIPQLMRHFPNLTRLPRTRQLARSTVASKSS